MSRRESYVEPMNRSKFMVDFWMGVYQLKQIFIRNSESENKNENEYLIPCFFSSHSGDVGDRRIDDVDIYDIDLSLMKMSILRDNVIPDLYSQLQGALQLQQSLRSAMKANLMTNRVTGYVKKKKFSFLNKGKGAAHLTTDTKLVPDVTSIEYRVCSAILYQLQEEFKLVVDFVESKILKTMDHIRDVLIATLVEADMTLTKESIDEAGLFLWSNPKFLTNWDAFVTSLQQKEDDIRNAATAKKNERKKSVLKKIRSSISSRKTATGNILNHELYERVASLAPIHECFLEIMEGLSSPSSFSFDNLTVKNSEAPTRRRSEISDQNSVESTKSKWYFGKLVGRKPQNRQARSETVSSTSSVESSDEISFDEEFIMEYSKSCGHIFITEEENATVEIDHRMIHSVVNPSADDNKIMCQDNNSDVRLFSWYLHVIMHNALCVPDRLNSIAALHKELLGSNDKETDKHCLSEYVKVGKDLMDNAVSTTQIVRSMRDLCCEEEEGSDEFTFKQTIKNLCSYVIQKWFKDMQRVRDAVHEFICLRREKVSYLIKEAMPICTEDEVEAIVTHDDGVHVHKLITAVKNGHTELARMLEARLKGPESDIYRDMKLFKDQSQQVVESLEAALSTPMKLLKC